jgi:hypothetical protein
MTNYGLEIYLNDSYLCRAGFENTYHVLTCMINSFRRDIDKGEELFLEVAGLNSETDQNFDWINTELKSGDRISIQIITDKFDKPSKIREGDSKKFILERKIEYYHKLKEELKEHLTD